MKKTLVVGDLHGCYDLAAAALSFKGDYNIVFLGDYVDSFCNSVDAQLRTIRLVLGEHNNNDVTALIGNHEASYLIDGMGCSGWKSKTAAAMLHLKDLVLALPYYVKRSGWLLSHAGVSARLLDSMGQTYHEYLNNGDYLQIGRARGGLHSIGGLLWCDWHGEFEPLPKLQQIVGHTHNNQGRIQDKGGSYCIDCLPYENLSNSDDVKFFVLEDEAPLVIKTEEVYERALTYTGLSDQTRSLCQPS